MTDQDAKRESEKMMIAIIDKCVEYALKDGLSPKHVMQVVGNALLKLSSDDDGKS